MVSILNFNLRQFISIEWSLFTLIQKSIQVRLGSLVIALWVDRCPTLLLLRSLSLLCKENTWLHLRLARVLCYIDIWTLFLSLVGSVGMLALTSLVYVLKNVSLYFHVIVWSICHFLAIILNLVDQSIEVVCLSIWVLATWFVLLLALHPAAVTLVAHIIFSIHRAANVAA